MTKYQLKKYTPNANRRSFNPGWVAIKGDRVIAYYLSVDFNFNHEQLPSWAVAVQNDYPLIAHPTATVNYIAHHELTGIKRAALKAGHGAQLAASVIAKQARRIIQKEEQRQFKLYRSQCRYDLKKKGWVVSGHFDYTGYEFIEKDKSVKNV